MYQVIDKFWGLRENVLPTFDDGQPQHVQPLDRATALLLESDAQWAYGRCNREAEMALQEELKEARALAEENGLLAKEKDSRAIELDAQLVLPRSSHGYNKIRSSYSKILDNFQYIFGAVARKGGGHSAGIGTCFSPEVLVDQVVPCGLLACFLGVYWALG